MSFFSEFAVPGMGTPVVTSELEFWTGRPEALQYTGGRLISSAVDAGGSPTTTLRKGLIVGQITASKKWTTYSPTATDGSGENIGLLLHGRNMLNPVSGSAEDQEAMILLAGGILRTASVPNLDETARKLLSGRFLFDDGRSQFAGPRKVAAKTANYTVVAADHGTLFTTQGAAGAVTFTLPALAAVSPGWEATFLNEVDQNLLVTAPANKLVAFNNATATTIAFQTASEKIGSGVRVTINADATKYIAQPILGTETATPTIS